MAEVLLFPQKKKLPKEIEKCLYKTAKEYVETVNELVVLLEVDMDDDSQYEEILNMVQETFTKAILTAVNELEGY